MKLRPCDFRISSQNKLHMVQAHTVEKDKRTMHRSEAIKVKKLRKQTKSRIWKLSFAIFIKSSVYPKWF